VTTARPVVAVVPFGARGRDSGAGAIGRQLARRLVDRFADGAAELRPVFLVAIPEEQSDAGYLVFGSTPDAALAASYGRSLGTSHALTGLYRDDGDRRDLDATLIEVVNAKVLAETTLTIREGELHKTERDLAAWLAQSLGVAEPAAETPSYNEGAYVELLRGLDEEVNATLLRSGAVGAEQAARARAFDHFVAALRSDPSCAAAEERLLVLTAESVERGDEARAARALEEATEIRPSSWRAQYLLGQLRVAIGETNAAIVALEHSHALHPLREADLVSLAELYVAAGWWGAQRDTISLRSMQRQMDQIVHDSKSTLAVERHALYGAASAHAYLALARGDTAEALRGFLVLPDSVCSWSFCVLDLLTTVHLLLAAGRLNDAVAAMDRPLPGPLYWSSGDGLWHLERARVAERVGRRSEAVREYAYVADAWRSADEELQPYVREARAALQRLSAEPRR